MRRIAREVQHVRGLGLHHSVYVPVGILHLVIRKADELYLRAGSMKALFVVAEEAAESRLEVVTFLSQPVIVHFQNCKVVLVPIAKLVLSALCLVPPFSRDEESADVEPCRVAFLVQVARSQEENSTLEVRVPVMNAVRGRQNVPLGYHNSRASCGHAHDARVRRTPTVRSGIDAHTVVAAVYNTLVTRVQKLRGLTHEAATEGDGGVRNFCPVTVHPPGFPA